MDQSSNNTTGLATSGFLIVEKYESLYQKYKDKYNLTKAVYGIPRVDQGPELNAVRYRGIDRDCLVPNESTPINLAEIRLEELNILIGIKTSYPLIT